MATSDKKEEEVYGENAVDALTDNTVYENIDPLSMEGMSKKEFMRLNDFPTASQPQNPLGDMIKGLTSMVTGRTMSQKLTLSGPVGEGQISMEITDSFTASMAHDIINRIMDEKKGMEKKKKQIDEYQAKKTVTGTSEQDIFEAMMKDSKKSKLLD